MEQYMWAIWLGVFIIALIIEALSPELVSIWFAAGALISVIVSLIPGTKWWIQLIIFVVVSVSTLLCLRPVIKKFMKRNIVNSNVDEIVHKKGKMTKACDELNHGEVKINGVLWTACSSDEKTPIAEGKLVEVLSISGNKLIVKEIKEE